MIEIEQVLFLHQMLINQFGGSHGVRDNGALESAISRPFMTFDGVDLYLGPIEKAAALLESMAKNHPFVDGNKRIAYYIARRLLNSKGIEIIDNEEAKYELVINVASGQYSYEDIVTWLKANTAPLS